ncbi:MAG: NADH-quinone oxidoreductase subunit [Verrucomicrobiota bacterium]|jgi:NADH-quinone oxidoreductase subunit L
MSWILQSLWLIPAVPLAASLAILSLGNSRRASAAALAIGGQIAALALSFAAFLPTLRMPGFRVFHNFVWFTFGDQTLRLGWAVDPLTIAMLLMITFVGLWIFVFSVGYMAGDKDFTRFFAYLSFFSGAMLGLVLANSLLLLFICWELVGLASYLLIGFWIHKPSAAAAAKKAFITTRIGDLGLFLGLLWLWKGSGTLLFYDSGNGCLEHAALLTLGGGTTAVALLILCGAMGKSGQFPLHVWLPDAMEGPTPVSALIHAATMVAAGVFLVARMYPLFSFGAINGVTPSLVAVVWIGVTTALLGALIAIAQADIKRILAYSTVSQLGLMMVSLGVGGVAAGILHLLAHGFFKALLFLGAGSVIHGCQEEQDIRKMGGLRRKMPITFLTYGAGMLALSGVPLIFSGGWTKEEVLHAASQWPQSDGPYYLMLLGVLLTALYMTRQMIYVFFGRTHAASEQAHESPPVMTRPLVVLALCVIALSVVLTPAWPWLHDYLVGDRPHFDLAQLVPPMLLVSLVLVAAGIGLGIFIYRRAEDIDPLQKAQPLLFRFLENKMWLDELYEHSVIALGRTAARISDWMDRYVWDGVVLIVGKLGQLAGIVSKGFDEHAINNGVDEGVAGAQGLGRFISGRHTGQVQGYLGVLAIGALTLLIIYAWLA